MTDYAQKPPGSLLRACDGGINVLEMCWRLPLYNCAVGACGQTNVPSDLVCAVSTDLYNSGAGCGDQYTLTYNGNSVTVRVVDLCPGCPSPGFDLSSGAFSQLADTSVGVIDCDYTKYDTLSTFQNTHPKLIRSYIEVDGSQIVIPSCLIIFKHAFNLRTLNFGWPPKVDGETRFKAHRDLEPALNRDVFAKVTARGP